MKGLDSQYFLPQHPNYDKKNSGRDESREENETIFPNRIRGNGNTKKVLVLNYSNIAN